MHVPVCSMQACGPVAMFWSVTSVGNCFVSLFFAFFFNYSHYTPLPKGAGGAEEARLWEPGRSETWQGPAAASSSERLLPIAAAGLGAAGIGIGHRDMPFEPRNSKETVLCKHEGCNEESARRQVQGALNQVGR